MDTGATNHITTQPGTLDSLFNKRIFSFVTIGNGFSAVITKTGHTTIPSRQRPLHLRDVLVCPSIIKNLVSVKRFVKDNNCTVEFDPLGFSIKDLPTRITLLRCDSSGPLYSIVPSSASSSPSLSTFTVSSNNNNLWHRRLGHPGISTLSSLVSLGFINFRKTDMTDLSCMSTRKTCQTLV